MYGSKMEAHFKILPDSMESLCLKIYFIFRLHILVGLCVGGCMWVQYPWGPGEGTGSPGGAGKAIVSILLI